VTRKFRGDKRGFPKEPRKFKKSKIHPPKIKKVKRTPEKPRNWN
jgi:hypothetical protein